MVETLALLIVTPIIILSVGAGLAYAGAEHAKFQEAQRVREYREAIERFAIAFVEVGKAADKASNIMNHMIQSLEGVKNAEAVARESQESTYSRFAK